MVDLIHCIAESCSQPWVIDTINAVQISYVVYIYAYVYVPDVYRQYLLNIGSKTAEGQNIDKFNGQQISKNT